MRNMRNMGERGHAMNKVTASILAMGFVTGMIAGTRTGPEDLLKRMESLEGKVKALEGIEGRVSVLEKTLGVGGGAGTEPAPGPAPEQTPSTSGTAPAGTGNDAAAGPASQTPSPTPPSTPAKPEWEVQDGSLAQRANDPGRTVAAPPTAPPGGLRITATSERGIRVDVTEIYTGPVMVKNGLLSDETSPTTDSWLVCKVVFTNASPSWNWEPKKFVPGFFARCQGKDLRKWKEVKGGNDNFDPGFMGATRRIPNILRSDDTITYVEVFEWPPAGATEVEFRAAVGNPWDLDKTQPFLRQTVDPAAIPRR